MTRETGTVESEQENSIDVVDRARQDCLCGFWEVSFYLKNIGDVLRRDLAVRMDKITMDHAEGRWNEEKWIKEQIFKK